MGGMSRHTERDIVIILTVLFELDRVVAFVTVENKEALNTFRTRPSVLIKVFNPFQT